MFKKVVFLSYFFLLFSVMAHAQETGYSMGHSLIQSPSGGLVLSITTNTIDSGLWLGISLYPPREEDTNINGKHFVLPIKKGRWIKGITIDPTLKNGTFEAAIWTQKIPKEQCSDSDTLCKKAGYKLKGMISYMWGYLTAP